MSSRNAHRASTVAAAVAVALAALGLPATQADAATNTTTRTSAALRLAGHPLPTEHRLAHTHSAAPTRYLVRSGDTLTGIAHRHHTTVDALRSANHLSGSTIYAGKQITLPPAGTTTWGTGQAQAAQPQQKRTTHTSSAGQYTIRPGDTLGGIARAHGITEKALRAANPALGSSSRIIAGKTLNLPAQAAKQQPKLHQAPKQRSSAPKVGTTFAGRTYKPHVTSAAQANKDALHRRDVPSRQAMQAMVASIAQSNGLDPKLAQAIAYQESGFNMRAVSPANAVGVMQVIPSSVQWASQMTGRQLDALNPEHNVLAGVVVLKANLNASGGDVNKAIAGYYQGLRSVNKNGMYADTQSYVQSVTTLMGRF